MSSAVNCKTSTFEYKRSQYEELISSTNISQSCILNILYKKIIVTLPLYQAFHSFAGRQQVQRKPNRLGFEGWFNQGGFYTVQKLWTHFGEKRFHWKYSDFAAELRLWRCMIKTSFMNGELHTGSWYISVFKAGCLPMCMGVRETCWFKSIY